MLDEESNISWNWPVDINLEHWLLTSLLLLLYVIFIVLLHHSGRSLFFLVALISATSMIFRTQIPSSFFCRWNTISFLAMGVYHLTLIQDIYFSSLLELFIASFVITTTCTTLVCEEWPVFSSPTTRKLKSPSQLNRLLIVSTVLVAGYLLLYLFIAFNIKANLANYLCLVCGVSLSLIRPFGLLKTRLIYWLKGPLDSAFLVLGSKFFRKEIIISLDRLSKELPPEQLKKSYLLLSSKDEHIKKSIHCQLLLKTTELYKKAKKIQISSHQSSLQRTPLVRDLLASAYVAMGAVIILIK